jgi:UbiD family decarboxylase
MSDVALETRSPVRAALKYPDLRDWLERVDELGQLRRLEDADWRLEIGATTEMALHAATPPCLLFDRIRGYPAGWRLMTNSVASTERAAMALGLPVGKTQTELVKIWRERARGLESLPAQFVSEGPAMDNVKTGADIDMAAFPAPLWHEHDGGRYIGTGCNVITSDPDTGQINVGTYRSMLLDRDKLGLYISPGHHGRLHREKYFERGAPMPVVLVLGMDPLLLVAGSLPLPPGTNEYDWAGGVKGTPVEVITGPVTGLPFPASAEIVVEGFVHPDRTMEEGPFGEWTGYYASAQRQESYVQIEALYHRDDPILLGAPPTKPPGDHWQVNDVIRFAGVLDALETAGVPDVQGVGRLAMAGMGFIVVSIKQRYGGHAKQAAMIAGQALGVAYLGRYVIVVDEDIDPNNASDVLWAMWSRADPAESVDLIRDCWSTPLDPRISPEQRARGQFTNSRLIINATRPFHWRDQFPQTVGSSPELQARMRQKWGDELFK